jgi:TrmH family RNA methyltransferase
MFPRRTHTSAATRLTSTKNPLLREVRRAVERGSLTSDGLCVAEGFHLLEEALRSPCEVEAVIASDTAAPRVHGDFISVPDDIFSVIASTETTQGVLTLVRPPEASLDVIFAGVPLVLVLDGIQDPGNAGTLLRAAEAFGATGVLVAKGTVNPWNPKSLRASAGSAFRIPVLRDATPEMLEGRGARVWATLPHGSAEANPNFVAPTVLIIGSEARGVSREWAAVAEALTIPTRGVESLNAAMAGTILLYEASRQRRA